MEIQVDQKVTVKNCWEIKNCGREKGGEQVAEFGECPASSMAMGHYCWVVAGTLCGGTVQGTFAQKKLTCLTCDIYKQNNTMTGTLRHQVSGSHAEEYERYQEHLRKAAESQ